MDVQSVDVLHHLTGYQVPCFLLTDGCETYNALARPKAARAA